MGTHLRVLSKSYPMNINVTEFRWFSKIFDLLSFDGYSLSIGRVKMIIVTPFCTSRCNNHNQISEEGHAQSRILFN